LLFPNLKEVLPLTRLEELGPVIEGSGDFKQIDKSSIEEKDRLYITVLVAKYSEKKRIYTIKTKKLKVNLSNDTLVNFIIQIYSQSDTICSFVKPPLTTYSTESSDFGN